MEGRGEERGEGKGSGGGGGRGGGREGGGEGGEGGEGREGGREGGRREGGGGEGALQVGGTHETRFFSARSRMSTVAGAAAGAVVPAPAPPPSAATLCLYSLNSSVTSWSVELVSCRSREGSLLCRGTRMNPAFHRASRWALSGSSTEDGGVDGWGGKGVYVCVGGGGGGHNASKPSFVTASDDTSPVHSCTQAMRQCIEGRPTPNRHKRHTHKTHKSRDLSNQG
jgi:hypothetical protein